MTGSQEVLFWYERTIISLQFLINLIRIKYFRIQASMNTENFKTKQSPDKKLGGVYASQT